MDRAKINSSGICSPGWQCREATSSKSHLSSRAFSGESCSARRFLVPHFSLFSSPPFCIFFLRFTPQGLWRPSLPSQLLALRWFRRARPPLRLPKYSAEGLRLSIQAIRGDGRWGSEREFPKGWDQLALKFAHQQPLLPEPVQHQETQ